MVAPQLGGAEAQGRVENAVGAVVGADQDPHALAAALGAQGTGLDTGGIRVRAGVGDVVDAHVQVADPGGLAVLQELVARHDAVEGTRGSPLDLPAEDLLVETGRSLGVVTGEVDEDQRVRVSHWSTFQVFGFAARPRRRQASRMALATFPRRFSGVGNRQVSGAVGFALGRSCRKVPPGQHRRTLGDC